MPVELVAPKVVYCPKCDTQLRLSDDEQEKGARITCPKCSFDGENIDYSTSKNEYKFCKHCGEKIQVDVVVCTKCGKQVEELKSKEEKQIIINNSNLNNNSVHAGTGRMVSKWTSFVLCLFLGWLGIHKFYEGKMIGGIVYMLTFGLFGIGWTIDTIIILFKSDPYYV